MSEVTPVFNFFGSVLDSFPDSFTLLLVAVFSLFVIISLLHNISR